MKTNLTMYGLILGALFVITACGGSPALVSAQNGSPPGELDAVIRETSDYLNGRIKQGTRLVILNIQSDFPALSEYIIEELIANTVNDGVFSVVDRQQLDMIRAELNFQMSGEVDDATAQELGRLAGAQTIVSGAVSLVGDRYRLRIRALNVQSAQIEGQFNQYIRSGATVLALIKSPAAGSGISRDGAAPAGTAAASTASAASTVSAVSAVSAPAPAPEPAARTYKIGETGPAGGLIFYDKGNDTGGWRYLEAAPADLGSLYGAREVIAPRTGREVGAGKTNTRSIMGEANTRGGGGFGWAAQACDTLVVNGFDDWFLPSRDELNYMYGNLHLRGLGNFRGARYWSSTSDGDRFWSEDFSSGDQRTEYRAEQRLVRAIRQL